MTRCYLCCKMRLPWQRGWVQIVQPPERDGAYYCPSCDAELWRRSAEGLRKLMKPLKPRREL